MKGPSSLIATCALVALGSVARAVPGERTDGQRILGICQTLLGEGSSFCEVMTDWSVAKTVDAPLADQPDRQGLSYTIRLIEGQTRYVLGMTSIVTLDGLIPEGTEVRGIVVSLQRATPTFPEEPLYTTVAGALIGQVDPSCGCPYVDSGGDLTVTLRDELGNSIPPSTGPLIESLEYGERLVVQLDAVYDLSAGVVLPGELVHIQACVQYAPSDEASVDGCFDEGGAVRTTRACSGFDFEAYAQPKSSKVTLEEAMQVPSHPWILPNGFKAKSGSELVTPNATLLPVVPGAPPVVFLVAASGKPNTVTDINVKGDVSCANVVDCGGASICNGVVTNTATLVYDDGRPDATSAASTTVVCAAHRCTPGEAAGCDDEDPCTSDSCEVGLGCVHSPYTGEADDGDACTSGEACVEGQLIVGETLTCTDDGNSCTQELCDPALGCVSVKLANRSDCEDGDPCTVDDLCDEGECESGAVISCDDHNPCTVDNCMADGACAHTPIDGGAGSCEDGNLCTVGDHCAAGSCVSGVGPACPDDGNPCTSETCETGEGCVHLPKTNQTRCEDGDACTLGDACVSGQCRAGAAASCDDHNACTNDGCDRELGCFNAPRAGTCDDGTACTSTSTCLDGVCKGTSLLDCNDDNPCTTDSCNATTGCKHDDMGGGTGCDDGDPCTTGDMCQGGTCIAPQLTECDDHNACTTSTCLPGQGCVHVPRGGTCEDGNKCTGPDTCQSGACVTGGVVSCDDHNPCTADSCTAAGGCKHAPLPGSCDDGDVCTGIGVCSAGTCQKGARLSCDDANSCTSGQCDAVMGCVQIPIGGSCDDHDPCTGTGTCQLGVCAAGPTIACDDHNPCTADYCKVGVGCATLPRSNVPCQDGKVCTANDTCQNGTCVGGAALDCNDGNPCTADSCGTNGCSNKPAAGGCSDGSLCTVGDSCVSGLCQPGAPKACADGDSCTSDGCVAATGACVNTRLANGSVCEDGEECTGCPWPEALVDRGFHALDAKPDATWFGASVPTATLELEEFIGPGTGKAWLTAKSDLRWVVLPNGSAYLRGTLSLPTGGAQSIVSEVWKIELAFSFRGVGRAGQGATAFYELPSGEQGTVWTDDWEYWGLGTTATLTRSQPSPDSATLAPDDALQSLPLQLGLRANGRNVGYGASMPLRWIRGTRAGVGAVRLNLQRAQCNQADTCGVSACVGGSIETACRDVLVGDYCSYSDQDFGVACQAGAPQSGACLLVQGFPKLAVERLACGATSKGVAFGHTGYARWGFTSAQKIDTFLPTSQTPGTATVILDQCDPGATSALAAVGRAFALALSIGLSDVGAAPAPGGVPLGELVRTSGACAGLSLREIARRAELAVSKAPIAAPACTDAATLDQEVTSIINGFRNCQGVMSGVGLPP